MRPAVDRSPPAPSPSAGDRLDAIWAATRPDEPSAALLDALWSQAAVELDRIDAVRSVRSAAETFPIENKPARRRLLTLFALAQAAVLLIGVGFVLSRRGPDATRTSATTPAQPSNTAGSRRPRGIAPSEPLMVDVGPDKYLVIRIDNDRQSVELHDQAPMFPAMAEHTMHDFYNAMETQATFPTVAENTARDFFDVTETKAIP